jgi:chromosome partitioning protein
MTQLAPRTAGSLVIAVVGLKGGVGKTTLAVGLAEAAAVEHGSALLVDADPQGSAVEWAEMAGEGGGALTCQVVSAPTADLRRFLDGMGASKYPVVVIDTPPGSLPIIEGALAAADIAAVPVRPTILDVQRCWATLDVAAAAGVRALVVLSQVRTGIRAASAAREALAAAGTPTARYEIPMREAIAGDYGQRPSFALRDMVGGLLLLELANFDVR